MVFFFFFFSNFIHVLTERYCFGCLEHRGCMSTNSSSAPILGRSNQHWCFCCGSVCLLFSCELSAKPIFRELMDECKAVFNSELVKARLNILLDITRRITSGSFPVKYLEEECKVPQFCQEKDCFHDCFMVEFYADSTKSRPLCESCASNKPKVYGKILNIKSSGTQYLEALFLSLGYELKQ